MIDIATGFIIERAHRLQHAEHHEELDARRQAAQQRRHREHGETDDEGALAAEPVRRGAREHQQARHHDGVGADRPLQPGDAGVQLSPIDGRATFTTVMSSPTMKRLRQQMSRTPILRLRLSSWMAACGLPSADFAARSYGYITIINPSPPGCQHGAAGVWARAARRLARGAPSRARIARQPRSAAACVSDGWRAWLTPIAMAFRPNATSCGSVPRGRLAGADRRARLVGEQVEPPAVAARARRARGPGGRRTRTTPP